MREHLLMARVFRDRHLGTLAGQPPWHEDARYEAGHIEKLVQMPPPADIDKLLDREIFTSRGAVDDLGLDPATMSEWARFLDTIVYSSDIEMVVRQQLFEKMRAQDWDPELRKVMFQRAMSLHRNTRKSIVTVDDLAKGYAPRRPALVINPAQLQKGDKLHGGKGDKKKASDFDPKLIAEGMAIEREHSDDPAIQREVTMDHLTEDKNYYRKLKTIEKADARGGDYHRRVPNKSGKGFRYYYTEDDYNKRADAHHSGEDMKKKAMGRDIDKALEGAGDKGASPADLKELAKKHGGKGVAGHLKAGCGEGGSMSYKGGRFYTAKKAKTDG